MSGDGRRFQKGSGVYTCSFCGKETRETGYGESGSEACRSCFEREGERNIHTDTHFDAPEEGCEFCEAEAK
ncbi:hypothetical protein LCGC14_2613770 [marine sediment metagenome]|uniref:Uncharacterized protein n=1 Tax=marine sediment metagenome TaxID=412755 RepID=A0A0F9A538_9ZZZZ